MLIVLHLKFKPCTSIEIFFLSIKNVFGKKEIGVFVFGKKEIGIFEDHINELHASQLAINSLKVHQSL